MLLSVAAQAQHLGGRNAFAFVQLPASAQQAALSGYNVSLVNRNVNLFLTNPALLNAEMDKQASVNYHPYYADISRYSLAYAHNFPKIGRWGAALQYVNYGEMDETDPTGAVIGSFTAREYVFTIAHARKQGNFTLGVNLKFAGSSIASYGAQAIMADIGGVFKHPEQDFTVGIVIKNAGFGVSAYQPGEQVSLPFDAQIGTSFKPTFAPLRLTFTAHHLHQFDIAYNDPAYNQTIDQNGNPEPQSISFADKLARHLSVGTELLLSKAFQVQVGYNHLLRQEMRVQNRGAGAGLSFGALLRIHSFELQYARAYHHAVGGTSHLTLTGNVGTAFKKKTKSATDTSQPAD